MVKKTNIKAKKTKEQHIVRGAEEFVASADAVERIRVGQKSKTAAYWWLEPDENIYNAVQQTITNIESQQSLLRNLRISFARLYGNYELLGYPYLSAGGSNTFNQNTTSNRIAINVIQSVIDTCSAKIAKNQPKISCVTTGSDDYFLKLRATKLTKYLSGLFKQSGIYENAEAVFRDACVVGNGYLKIFEDEGQIKTEWCAIGEVVVDELDGMYQDPRSIHQIRLLPRDSLLFRFPDKAEMIEQAQSESLGKMVISTTTDLIRVIESWHLPTTQDSGDGKHCISLTSGTVFSEEYTKDYFPIITFRWMQKPLGFWGRGIAEELTSLQTAINNLLVTIQRSIELAAVPMVFVSSGAKVASDHLLNNTIARMISYDGPQPPIWITPTAQNGEVYQWLKWLIDQAYQIVGITQTAASGQKPAGVESNVAIRTVQDIETSRFSMVAKRWEDLFITASRIMIDLSKDLYSKNPDLKVGMVEKKMLHEISWKDVNLDTPFEIQCFPTSQLPDSPAGRMETISEYIDKEWISKEFGMSLLNLDADLEGEVNRQTSSLRLAQKWISEMVEDGVYHIPEPYMNLDLTLQVAQTAYTQLQVDSCPEDRLELIRQFINDTIELQQSLQGPPPAPEGMMPPDPGMMSPEMGPPPGMPPMDMGAPPPEMTMPPLPVQ